MSKILECCAPLLLPLLALPVPATEPAPPTDPLLHVFQQEFQRVPCDPAARRAAVVDLFQRMGADPEAIEERPFAEGTNVLVRLPGKSSETLFIGAHFDRSEVGCGAVDNWTGVVTVAHLYRALKDQNLQKTYVFAAFDQEENGLRGSAAIVLGTPAEERSEVCAMVNLDSLGLEPPWAAEGLSDPDLLDHALEVAKTLGVTLPHGKVEGISDSDSFNLLGIPALSIVGLGENVVEVIHTEKDQAAEIDANLVVDAYRLVLALLRDLDGRECGAWR